MGRKLWGIGWGGGGGEFEGEAVFFFLFLLLAFSLLGEPAVEHVVGLFGLGELGDGSEGAEFGVGEDFFDEFGLGRLLELGEVHGGDLEAVEEEAGAARVDVAGGDAAEDLGDGKLDAGAVVGGGEVEEGGVCVGFGDEGCGRGAAMVAVVVAEGLVAEGRGAAAVAVGEDVAALETDGFGGFGCDRHGGYPPWVLWS